MKLQSRCSGPGLVFCLNAHTWCCWLLLQMNSNPNIVWKKKRKKNSFQKKVPKKGSVLFPFSICYISAESSRTQFITPREKNKPSIGLKENLASSKSDALLDLHRVWKERKTRSQIYQGGFSALCDKRRRPFFLHGFFFLTFLSHFVKKWSSKRSERWTFVIFEDFGEQRYWWKRLETLFNRTWTLGGDLYSSSPWSCR